MCAGPIRSYEEAGVSPCVRTECDSLRSKATCGQKGELGVQSSGPAGVCYYQHRAVLPQRFYASYAELKATERKHAFIFITGVRVMLLKKEM